MNTASASLPFPLLGTLTQTHHVRLRDGTRIDVRPILPEDGDRLQRFHTRLSPTTTYQRYFHVVRSLPDAMIATFTHVDYVNRMALVALPTVGVDTTTDSTGSAARCPLLELLEPREMVALANYVRLSADAAEVAFVVEDAWQGRGVARILLYDLATHAHECGFRRLLATTLRRNVRMLTILRQCGFPCTVHDQADAEEEAGGEVAVWLDISSAPVCRLAFSTG